MKLNILVIDDTAVHQQAARQVFGEEHNLTVVGTHDGALELLRQKRDEEKYETLKAQYKEQGVKNYYERADEESRLPYWDAVLSDLLMPAGRAAQGGEGLKYVGQEMPVGWSLAIIAALRGAKYVAVVTDKNHHHHPASAMLDSMSGTVFCLHEARALFTNNPRGVGIKGSEKACDTCSGTGKRDRGDGTIEECYYCHGSCVGYSVKGKDWADVLAQLREVPPTPGVCQDSGDGCGPAIT